MWMSRVSTAPIGTSRLMGSGVNEKGKQLTPIALCLSQIYQLFGKVT